MFFVGSKSELKSSYCKCLETIINVAQKNFDIKN